jgi:long-chain acyl-CoA synthetase
VSDSTIPVRRTYAGKHILLTGASGFLGKVWLAMALEMLPEVGRIHVLLRPGARQSARGRFENLLNTSPVFERLHTLHGADLSRYLCERVQVVEGDLAKPDIGVVPVVAARLQRDLDLVVNCAGQVDFAPDLRRALSANVDAAFHLASFVKQCERASLLHVSTCYVAGVRQGWIEELAHPHDTPLGEPFDGEQERVESRLAVERVFADQQSEQVKELLQRELKELTAMRPGARNDQRFVRAYSRRWLRERLLKEMVREGKRRARGLGWQNTYTYSKAMAESLLAGNGRAPRFTLFRPSIIESSLDFPFPGWNQGFNASAPLAYLLGTWFHQLPARSDVPFDVVPVDMVCRALTLVGAALMLDRHAPVYHVGTSELNRFTLGRACELTDLGHRRYLRGRGQTGIERVLLSRWDTKVVNPDHLLSVRNLRRAVGEAGELLEDCPKIIRKRSRRARTALQRTHKRLGEIEDLLEMFQPFIHDNFQVFACRQLFRHEPEEPEFRFTPEQIDWRKYWIEVHMPGLRRWVFPKFEGRQRETYRPEFPVSLPRGDAEPEATGPSFVDQARAQGGGW